MSFYDEDAEYTGFELQIDSKSDVIRRFHRTLMDRRQPIDWTFDSAKYPPELVARAADEWAQRAIAEYQSTAQFAQLLHRLTLVGAPLEIVGAATRLATDECRHAELCSELAKAMGARPQSVTSDGLSLYADVDDLPVACALTLLAVCCFGETLSVPMFRALTVVTTDPLAHRVATIICSDEEYHSLFGWEALRWFVSEMTSAQRVEVLAALPGLMGHFERICRGGPEVYQQLVGREYTVERTGPNLGTLPSEAYASIFYDTIETSIMPTLEAMGFDARDAWAQRPISRL